MSFLVPQDRARLSYSQPNLLPSFQIQQTAVRSSQAPTASPFSFQTSNLSHSHPHPHSQPQPQTLPESYITISDRNKQGSVSRHNSIPQVRPQDNTYLLQLQETSQSIASSQPSQQPDVSHSIPNGVSSTVQNAMQSNIQNNIHRGSIDSQAPSNTNSQVDNQDATHEIAQMTRPPEGIFPTFEALLSAANQHAFSRGYAFVIGRSKKKNKLGLKKVLLSCDKGGTSHHKMLPPDSEKRKRKTTTRKTGCEFGVYAIESQTEWTLKYRPDPACAMHNHGPSKSVTEHPAARKLNPTAIAAVKAMKDAGVSAQDTLKEIQRENPTTILIARDVYNARAALRREPERAQDPAISNAPPPPQIYRRANMTPEERLRDDLRMEVTKAREEVERMKDEHRKEIEGLQKKLKEKDKMIEKFEMFIDICNQRVMVQRERLTDGEAGGGGGGS